MSNYCIVCEYNPLHNGHKYLIDVARSKGADTVTCIMSGNSTQRGELAITDKYLRAEAAIKCGADLVLELPFPWCSASAEYFALAAVSIAGAIGDSLLFGSECGDITRLYSAAELCETEDFKNSFEECKKSGVGAAAAYIQCLSEGGYDNISSNDILGISYIRAIKRLNMNITAEAETRIGADYNHEQTVEGIYQSATALRKYIENEDISSIKAFMPQPMLDIITEELKSGRITDINQANDAFIGFFRLKDATELDDIAEMNGGLSNRFVSAAKQSVSVEEMLEKLKTKRYTDAKLRRAMLFALTGTENQALKSLPEYTLLLGANDKGRALLAESRKKRAIKIITKPADAPRDTLQFVLSDKLDSIYGLARKQKYTSDEFIKKKAYIEK